MLLAMEEEKETRIIVGLKMRIKPPKRRTPQQRLRAKLYYRKNRAKIRTQRRRYMRKWKTTVKNRKLFKRFKPSWFKKPSAPKKPTKHKIKKFKVSVPKFLRPKTKTTPKKPSIMTRPKAPSRPKTFKPTHF